MTEAVHHIAGREEHVHHNARTVHIRCHQPDRSSVRKHPQEVFSNQCCRSAAPPLVIRVQENVAVGSFTVASDEEPAATPQDALKCPVIQICVGLHRELHLTKAKQTVRCLLHLDGTLHLQDAAVVLQKTFQFRICRGLSDLASTLFRRARQNIILIRVVDDEMPT